MRWVLASLLLLIACSRAVPLDDVEQQMASDDDGELVIGIDVDYVEPDAGGDAVVDDEQPIAGQSDLIEDDDPLLIAGQGSDEQEDASVPDDAAVEDEDSSVESDSSVVVELDSGSDEDSSVDDQCDPPGGVVHDCSPGACDWSVDGDGWPWCEVPSCVGMPVAYSDDSEDSILLPSDDEADQCWRCSGTNLKLRWIGEAIPSWRVRVTAPEGSVVVAYPDLCDRLTWATNCLVVEPREMFVVMTDKGFEAGWLHLEPSDSEDLPIPSCD